MNNKQFKTSESRREYQRNYYKLRQQKLIEEEKQKTITGGNILQEKINSDSDELKLENIYRQKPTIDINNVVPKLDKELIIKFKLKQAISYIQLNINKNAEDYIMDLAEALGYNIETTDGCYEFLKVLEKYLGRTF